MSWEFPFTFVVDDVLLAEDLNRMLRNNMNETPTAKASKRASYFVSDSAGSNEALSERQPVTDYIGGSIEVTSTSFVTGGGPSVSVEHGTKMFIMWSARIYVSTTAVASCTVAVDGSGASLSDSLRYSGTRPDIFRGSCYKFVEGLTPGTSTVDLRYLTASGTANFGQRRLLVWPL